MYYAYDINHPFGLNVKYAAFHIFPSVDIREMEVKLNTGKKIKILIMIKVMKKKILEIYLLLLQ